MNTDRIILCSDTAYWWLCVLSKRSLALRTSPFSLISQFLRALTFYVILPLGPELEGFRNLVSALLQNYLYWKRESRLPKSFPGVVTKKWGFFIFMVSTRVNICVLWPFFAWFHIFLFRVSKIRSQSWNGGWTALLSEVQSNSVQNKRVCLSSMLLSHAGY
jgi:hypothetical protein